MKGFGVPAAFRHSTRDRSPARQVVQTAMQVRSLPTSLSSRFASSHGRGRRFKTCHAHHATTQVSGTILGTERPADVVWSTAGHTGATGHSAGQLDDPSAGVADVHCDDRLVAVLAMA
jgi:hypothetical protein